MTALGAEPLKPARGVDLAQVLPVTAVLAALGAAAVLACVMYRRGRLPGVERALAGLEARTGVPAWSSVPAAVSGLSLMTAGFGFYWDVAVHIDNGRDSSPFGTPAHWPIVLGLCGLVLAGILAITLDRDTDGGAAIRLPGGLSFSLGAGLVLLCGSISLLGFPLDDLWHNAFGQDVTLWSPTHIQMVGGASLTTLATWVLIEEGRRRSGGRHLTASSSGVLRAWARLQPISIAGAFLIGLSTLQAEFDYGVPQFSPAYHPILLALAAGIGLVAARVKLGRGGALLAALFFVVVRGTWALVIHGAFGLSLPHEPVYLAEALLVEVAAVAVGTSRPVRFGLLAGGLVGTAGLAAEWAWSHVAFPLPWQEALLPEAVVLAALAGLAGGALGALTGRALQSPDVPRMPAPRLAAGLALAAAVGVVAVVLPLGTHDGYRAAVEVQAAGEGTAHLTVRVSPAELAEGAAWFNVTSWQGGQETVPETDGFVITPLERVSEGVYRTSRPVPVVGQWKTLIRLATTTTSEAVPVYLPEDPAIPAEGVPALARFEREFVPDVTILQREQVGGSDTLKQVAYAVLGVLALLWVVTLALGLQRLDRAAAGSSRPLDLRRAPEGALA